MKKLLLSAAYIFLTGLAYAQPIQSAGDKMPQLRATAKKLTPAHYAGRQIVVGSGGGFTGASVTYYLLDNGQLFGRRNRDTTYTFIGQQTENNTKRVFVIAEDSCKIKRIQFSKPGNTYQFVQWRKGKQNYKITWPPSDKTVPTNFPKFYDSFMAMIPVSTRLK